MAGQEQRLSARVWGRVSAPWAVFALGVAIHLPYLVRLGLWNDDVVMFLQPHHAAAGDAARFVVADATAFLAGGERPAAYPPFALARVAYLAGVPALHLLAVALSALAAALFARFARRLLPDEGAAFATGALALLWPLAPLVLFWPSSIHFTVAAALALVAAEWAVEGRRPIRWATGAHLLAGLTLEAFLFAAPLWTLVGLAVERARASPGARPGGGAELARRAARTVGPMLAASGAIALWRLVALPRLGLARLGYEELVLGPRAALEHAAGAWRLLWPWPDAEAAALELGLGAPAPATSAYLVLLAAAATGLAFGLAGGARDEDRARIARRAWLPGLVLAAAWAVQLAFVPGAYDDSLGLRSRLSYPAAFAVAAALAGLLATLGSPRSPRLRAAGRIAAGLALFAALGGGARLHARLAEAHAADAGQSARRMEEIAAACPTPAPDSLVLVDTAWPSSLLRMGKGGMSHPVLSSLLGARFDDPSLRGVRMEEVRVIPGGVRPLEFGQAAVWFAPGERGPLYLDADEVADPVAFDRLVTLGTGEDGRLGLVPSLGYSRTRDRRGELWGDPARCAKVAARPPSAAWCHAFPATCRRPEAD